jgi:hypothetical protein
LDAAQFDTLARSVVGRQGRRRFALLLGGLAIAPLLGNEVEAGKKKKPKKKPVCLNGQTSYAAGKKRKKLLKQGATPGACSDGCTPQCNGTSCGADGCGGTCGCTGNTVCDQGTCKACTVICGNDSPATCGTRLAQALLAGGRIVVCPGQYLGAFNVDVNNTTLIGAGSGSNPAVDTILKATAGQRPLGVPTGITTFVSRLHITGGDTQFAGGGVRGDPNSVLFMDQCAVVDNHSWRDGSGISSEGRLTLTRSTVTGNGGQMSVGGAGIALLSNGPHLIENSVITGNEAFFGGVGGEVGGGLYCSGATVDIRGTEFSRNVAGSQGGGIFLENSTVTLDSATRVVNNQADFQGGGGIWRQSGNVNFSNATVSGNIPDNCAGADNFTCPG